MPHRQTVEFLRRRYAAAILRDDADTAGRLRAQLDGMMNPAGRSGRQGEAARAEPEARLREALTGPPGVLARLQAAERSPGRLGPRLHLVVPVTGLIERRRLLPVAAPAIASSRDPAAEPGNGSREV
jgi:hypothetical protein